ncbi:MAG: LysR family transcriptional regulator, partial [Eggerthellaceae bacterium]|nr:LysR family transcriptional regulator [Eggerthellaceae bacterium]
EVADTGSITQASKRLFISQPSVSVQIQNLEHEYGAQLFSRTNRGVTLTVYGKILYDQVVVALRAVEQAKESIREYVEREGKVVHIGATFTIGEYLLPHMMGLTHDDNSSPKFNVNIANTKAVVQGVVENKLGIGLIEGPATNDEDINVEQFWSDELVIIVPYHHPWASRTEVDFEEFIAERFISREKGSGTRKVIEVSLKSSGFDPNQVNTIMELNSTQAIKEAVMAGLGISVLSTLTIQEECRRKRLATLRIKECHFERPLNVITNVNANLTAEEYWFLEQIKNREVIEHLVPNPLFNDAQTDEGAGA